MPGFGWAKLGDGADGDRCGLFGGAAVPMLAGGLAGCRGRGPVQAGAAMTTGIRFIEEPPELMPRHEASFYGHIDNHIGINPFEYVQYIASFGWLLDYPEWKYPSPWMAEQPLPPEAALLAVRSDNGPAAGLCPFRAGSAGDQRQGHSADPRYLR